MVATSEVISMNLAGDDTVPVLNVPGLSENEIHRLADQGLPLIIPWHRNKTVRLGTCFHSSRLASQDPWGSESPFILQDLILMQKILSRENGTVSSYKSIITSKTSETGDHLSLGFGVGVGLPFLASVSVKGTYDKDIQENKDVRSSLHEENEF